MRINHSIFKNINGRQIMLCAGLLSCLLATGCAFSRTETQIHFAPSVNQPLKAERKESLAVSEIKDSRAVKDPYVILHKQNAYGTTTGAYVSKTPVADIVKSGLSEALDRNGFIKENPRYDLVGDIQDFSLEVMAGFWTATVKPKLIVRFELIEKASGKSVWRDTLIGRTTGQTALGTKEFLAELFSKTSDDLVQQLVVNRTFRGYFE